MSNAIKKIKRQRAKKNQRTLERLVAELATLSFRERLRVAWAILKLKKRPAK